MQNENAAKTVHAIIQNRIDYLKNIIETGNEDSMEWAMMHLGVIGTKASSEILMRMAEQESSVKKREQLATMLIGFSSFRDDYKERLMVCCNAGEISDMYTEVEELTMQHPCSAICQEILEALESCVYELPTIDDPAVGD